MLTVFAVLAVSATTALAQPPAYSVDMNSVQWTACERAITDKVKGEHPGLEKLQWLSDTLKERQKSNAETAVNGSGQYLGGGGKWNRFTFHCVYNIRDGKLTTAEYNKQ